MDCLAGAGAAADLVGRLQHGDLHPFAGKGGGRGEPVGSAADHDRGTHLPTPDPTS